MTAQVHEELIYEGEVESIAAEPGLPENHERIIQTDTGDFCTACWRGYYGTWEIKDDKLYLIHLEGNYKMKGAEPLFAEWVTKEIMIPKGEMLNYVHMGFLSSFETEIYLTIEKGIVVDKRIVHNREDTDENNDNSKSKQ